VIAAFSRLTLRERLLIGALVVIGGGAAYVHFVWQPMTAARENAQRRIVSADRALAAVAALDGPILATAPAQRPPPARRITESARGAGLTLRRIESDGGLTRLVLTEAEFAVLIDWLAVLERDHALLVASIEIDRRPEPGIVSARIALEEQ